MQKSKEIIPGVPNLYVFAAGGALVLYLGVLNPLLKKLGFKKSDEEKANDEAAIKIPGWDPNFYRSAPSGSLILTSAAAENFAKTLYNAFGFWNDDEEAVYGVIKSLKTQSQLSFLAAKFFEKYQKDLYEYLRGAQHSWHRLEEEELAYVNKLVAAMPKYKV
jgi:hypothetical protein